MPLAGPCRAGRSGAGLGVPGLGEPLLPLPVPQPQPGHAGAAARPAGRLGPAAAAAAMAAAPGALEEGGGGAGAAGAQPGADGGGGAAISGAGERPPLHLPEGNPHLGPFPARDSRSPACQVPPRLLIWTHGD